MDTTTFYEQYKEPFLDLLKIPLVTCCKHKHQLIPYEYAQETQSLKSWRTEASLKPYLKTHPQFLVFCLKNGITKYLLQVIQGGNLLLFKKIKEIGF